MAPTTTRILRTTLALGLALGLAACASVDSARLGDTATRDTPVSTVLGAPSPASAPVILPSYKVVGVNVTVPRELSVSEANRYLPRGDIVWREDPIGDRHEQVRVIVENALTQGGAALTGNREVVLDVVVRKFHALTEKARYTVGGVHAIQFDLTVRDAATGEIVREPRFIKADFPALGGQAAIAAEARGITQKVRITQHLGYVIQQELGTARGYVAQRTGLIGAMNQT